MTIWASKILENHQSGSSLAPALEKLFVQQRSQWPLFREGELALTSIPTKVLTWEGSRVVIQANLSRKGSIHAKVDRHSVAARRCFLCPENMPAEERGIGLEKLVILPNPFPIMHRHCTIPDRVHQPQKLSGRIASMCELAHAVGPEMLLFYNGPRCGASAPDHFHFQACEAGNLGLLSELPEMAGPFRMGHCSLGRNMLVVADASAERMQKILEDALGVLGRLTDPDAHTDKEPMVNLLMMVRDGFYWAILFPRAAHRPSCFDAEKGSKISVSPAALEMAGLLVVPDPDQLERIDKNLVESIYQEVSLDEVTFSQFLDETLSISV